MKPIKNVFPASEGSEKWYSVNEGGSTKMLVGRKQDKLEVWGQDSSYVHYFKLLQLCFKDTSFF